MFSTQFSTKPDLATEPDNRMVWDGKTPGRYEVWYVTLNDRAGRAGFWIRYTLEAPLHGAPYAQLWFSFFDAADPTKTFGLTKKLPIDALKHTVNPFEVAIGEARLHHDSATGALAGDGHQARWDLRWLPSPSTHRHLPDLIYRTTFADTTVLSPNLDVPVRGTIEVDGRTFHVEGEPGDQTHVWGKKHAHAWAWGHCNAFEGRRGAAFEALTVRLKRGPIVLPPLTLVALYLEGEALRFTGFADTLAARGSFGAGRYAFSAQDRTRKIEGEFSCAPDAMLLAEYADPDGEASFCHNTEIGDLRIRIFRRGSPLARWRPAGELVAPGTGHFEIGQRTPDPHVERRLVTIA